MLANDKQLSYIKMVVRRTRLLVASARRTVRDEWLGSYLSPLKPTVIQFPVNDICNSRCMMCNIWQRKRDKEITPEELRQILADPLFDNVHYVGMNGGEPTLRPDLAEIGQVLIESLPKLRGMGIITNALRPQMVIERSLALAKVAAEANISFGVNVSLDGIGEDHDRNRGIEGNFASAMEVIRVLKEQDVSLSIGCTLTPVNCYGADDVLLWCEENGIKVWEFRLGVEIKRVYNEGYTQQYPFLPEQHFHVVMFFDKLASYPLVDDVHRSFYRSLVGQLAFGLSRQAGCDWQSRGVTLDTRGNISYCSVQSPILGSALVKSAEQIFREGLSERQRIIREHCSSCQHDLLGPPPFSVVVEENTRKIFNRWRRLYNRFKSFRVPKSIYSAQSNIPSRWKHVLITGWYGTETAGDKAILGELLHFLGTYAPGCQITLTTLDRKVSHQTNLELSQGDVINLIGIDKGYDPALIESVDAVIIGGGPLEEIEQMEYIWRMFAEANRQRKARIIFGCGVGPLYSDRFRQMVGAICQMTTAGFLRDKESLDYARQLGAENLSDYACDPALGYVKRWVANLPDRDGNDQLRIATLVRANTGEYVSDVGITELNEFNVRTARQIAQILEPVCEMYQARLDLLAMHAIWFGGDDRLFNRQVASFFKNSTTVHVERRYLSLETLLHSLYAMDVAVTMRYHGHLFCMAMGVPFLSIDYTGKPGKVHSLIQRLDYGQWSEGWRSIDVDCAISRLQQLCEEHSYWSTYLQQRTDDLVFTLNQTYAQVFGLTDTVQ